MQLDAACRTPVVGILPEPPPPVMAWAVPAPSDLWDPCDHADELMHHVAAAALHAEAGGSVPADLMLSTQNTVHALLPGAVTVFEHMAELVVAARSEVLLQTFCWEDVSDASAVLRAALVRLEAQQQARAAVEPVQPVVVRIMVRRSPTQWLERCPMPLLRDLVAALDPAFVQVQVMEHPERLIGAMHSKSLVVDGCMAVLSGANVERRFDRDGGWFDTGILLGGEVVRGLRADALQLHGRCRVRWSNAALPPPDLQQEPFDLGLGPDMEAGNTPMLVISRRGQGNPWRLDLDTPKDQAVLAALANAQRRICLMSPNLNFPPVMNALESALLRGVRVDLLLSHGFNDGSERLILGQGGTNAWAVARLRERLAHCPAALARLRVRWFSADGGYASQGNGARASHAKGLCVDDCLLLVGSFNFDTQSSHSREIGVAIGCAVVARRWLGTLFDPGFARGMVG